MTKSLVGITLAILCLVGRASAGTFFGALSNFDAVNDTGSPDVYHHTNATASSDALSDTNGNVCWHGHTGAVGRRRWLSDQRTVAKRRALGVAHSARRACVAPSEAVVA